MLEEIQWYTVGFVFGLVRIQSEYIDDLIRVHGAKYNRTLTSRIISQ